MRNNEIMYWHVQLISHSPWNLKWLQEDWTTNTWVIKFVDKLDCKLVRDTWYKRVQYPNLQFLQHKISLQTWLMSSMNVDRLTETVSRLAILVNMRSRRPITADSAGTKLPMWAKYTIKPTWDQTMDTSESKPKSDISKFGLCVGQKDHSDNCFCLLVLQKFVPILCLQSTAVSFVFASTAFTVHTDVQLCRPAPVCACQLRTRVRPWVLAYLPFKVLWRFLREYCLVVPGSQCYFVKPAQRSAWSWIPNFMLHAISASHTQSTCGCSC